MLDNQHLYIEDFKRKLNTTIVINMIQLKLIRKNPVNIDQNYTEGELFVKSNSDHWLDFCYTLEDKTRDINKNGKFDNGEKKVYSQTAIPFGKYDGKITFSHKLKRELPLVINVTDFAGIRIHSGNTIDHTSGCILVGYKTDNKGKIWKSKDAEVDLINLIKQNHSEGRFTLEII